MINRSENAYMDDSLSCPLCGGSGHIDDVQANAVEQAYGLLWRYLGNDKTIHEARVLLLSMIGSDGQKRGIEFAIEKHGPVVLPINEME